ncbi:MAG TPA: hypothetical protein DCX52_11755 [Massilia sp.]|nr:hypothetical protein [Massilia sp.]
MKLQIKDSGAWRNVVIFDPSRKAEVEAASAALLQAAGAEKTSMRICEGDQVQAYCEPPGCSWRSA